MAIAVKGEPLAALLWRYKAGPATQRAQCAAALADLLAGWLAAHRRCLHGADRTVVIVPARSSGPALHRVVRAAGLAPVPLLSWQPPAPRPPEGPTARSRAALRARRLAGQQETGGDRPVLLIDDTWTTGATASAAGAALKAAGATRVVALVLGRHVGPGYEGALDYLRRFGSLPYRVDRCCLCAGGSDPAGRGC